MSTTKLFSKCHLGFFLTTETLGRMYITHSKNYPTKNQQCSLKVVIIKVYITEITFYVSHVVSYTFL